MTRFRLVRSSIFAFALVAAVASRADRMSARESSGTIPARSFEFTYQVHVPANADPAGPTHLWIPLPQADGYQDILSLHIDSPVSYAPGRDAVQLTPLPGGRQLIEQPAQGSLVVAGPQRRMG